ncbi:MAG: hypothetical protein R3F11_08655 [Verrucomicrobiales bacterium]
MKRNTFSSRWTVLAAASASALFLGISAHAAELRTWTSLKGTTLDAKLLKVDGEDVILEKEDGTRLDVKRNQLSIGDQRYLQEYGGAEELGPQTGRMKSPAKEVKIDKKEFVKTEEPFRFGEDGGLEFHGMVTPHFYVVSDGRDFIRETAENAERLWHDMAFYHPNFARKWGDKKFAIVLVKEDEPWFSLADWQKHYLDQYGQPGESDKIDPTWKQASSTSVNLTQEMIDKYNTFGYASVFRPKDARTFDGVWAPFRTHCLAQTLLGLQMGGVSSFGSKGFFAIATGHAYFKEIDLTGETQTRLISAEGYESDKVTSAGGFDKGDTWPKTLQKLVRKKDVTPSIKVMYQLEQQNLTPERVVLMYSFARYLQSTPERVAAFAKLAERIDTSRQMPVAEELADIYGFESVEKMEEDWIDYLKSSDFK